MMGILDMVSVSCRKAVGRDRIGGQQVFPAWSCWAWLGSRSEQDLGGGSSLV